MKNVLAIICYITAATALAIPSPSQQVPLAAQSEAALPDSSVQEIPVSDTTIVAANTQDTPASDAPIAAANTESADLEAYRLALKTEASRDSCFCAGGALCCETHGETDCGFGACGI